MPLSAYLGESAEEKYVSCQAGKDTELDIIQRGNQSWCRYQTGEAMCSCGDTHKPLADY